jgi:hypothetical protein
VAERCQIGVEASDESHRHVEPCGAPAAWWSDDVSPDRTIWMCDRHVNEALRRADDDVDVYPASPDTVRDGR